MRSITTGIRYILLLIIFLFLQKIGYAAPPNWSVNPADFSLSKNMAVQLFANGSPLNGSGNIFGVFVNGEVRGVANETPGLASYFFLNAYSNSGSDILTFKVYVADDDQIYDISETMVFSDILIGNINPLTVLISSDQPIGLAPFAPETQIQGYPFQTINLPDSLIQYDSDVVDWTYSGSSNLNVTITDSILNVIPFDSNWTGTETITITATEQTPNAYSASQDITYTVIPDYGPPNLGTVNDQTIGLNQNFQGFNLNDVLAPYPGDSLIFDYFMPQATGSASDQGWSINSGSFQYTLTVTAVVHYGNNLQHSNGSKLLAFIDGNLAGIATPILSGNDYLYFLNVYANTNNQPISFKFFDNDFNQLYTIQHTETFQSNGNIGTPGSPLFLNTAPLNATIDANGNVTVGVEAPGWTGQQVISFIAADGYQPIANSDISSAVFEVLNENAPEISNIPNQYIATGESFNTFDLDHHLTELDGDLVNWSTTGATNLQVNINAQNVVTITPIDPTWVGEETITFTATDQTVAGLFTEETAIFSMSLPNQAPQISNIPDQVIVQGGTFPTLDLNAYLNEPNGDEVLWSYYFPQTLSNGDFPDWTITPSQFAYNMSLTTKVKVRGIYPDAASHKLAAFHDGELRGVATPSNLTGEWLFSLTIYSNQSQDSIYFKYFHGDQSTSFAVDDSLRFISQQIIGNINNPFEMEAGYIAVTEENDFLDPTIIDKAWTGSDTVYVIAQELGTINNYADTASIIFRIDKDNTLPVDLLSFKGKKIARTASLTWEIANPENVEGYEIQRAKLNTTMGGLEWDHIGFAPHLDEKQHYDFLDDKPNLTENYYRLKMVDFDGAFTYSPIIQLDFSTEDQEEVRFYPNPTFGDPFYLELNTTTSNLVTIEIVDAAARKWTNIILYADSNRQIVPLDISHYPPGLYYAKIKIGHRKKEQLIIVAKD